MKNVITTAVMLTALFTGTAFSQQTGDKEKMKAFTSWEGRWQGESSMQMGPGEPRKAKVDERIEYKLEGMIVLVEGTGKATDESGKNEFVVHHALAVLSYDKVTAQYKFKTYLNDGRSTDAWFKVTGENNYEWGFDTERGKIRYAITIDPNKKTWYESGEFSADGTTWRKFFDMNLRKVE